MPEWLTKDENYAPIKDRDTFINKSILSLLRVLARIRAQGSLTDRFGINPFLMVLFTLMLALLISLSRSFAFVFIVVTYLALVLSFFPAKEIISVLRVGALATLFAFAVLLPAALSGSGYNALTIPSKVFATVTAVNLLSHSARWDHITGALKRFRLPDIFTFVLDITVKYIVMLGEFSLGMLYALKLRSVGKNRSKYASMSGVAGTMFIKSREMAEEMHAAMECRGFTGEYRPSGKLRFHFADFLYIMINVGILSAFIYLS